MYGRRSTLAASSALAALALLTACGGGGGGSHVPPTPTPTPTGGPVQFACTSQNGVLSVGRQAAGRLRTKGLPSSPITPSTYTYDSNPEGLVLTRNGSGFGSTKKSDQPGFSNDPYYLTIKGSAGQLDLCFAQAADGNHTLYYNSMADTNGTLVIGSATATRSYSTAAYQRAAKALPRLMRRFPARHTGPPQVVPGRIEVLYDVADVGDDLHGALALERAHGVTNARSIGPVRNNIAMRVVGVPAGSSPDAFAATMRAQHGVHDARAMYYRYLQSSTPFNPNDPEFSGAGGTLTQWDMYRLNMPNAWGYTHGSPSVPIAIIDTGVDLIGQQELQPIGPGGKVTYQESVLSGVVDKTPGAAQDHDGHGTDVAGIAAEDTDNAFGFAGVGYNSTLQAYRIFPNPTSQNPTPGADPSDEAQAIYDAVNNGVKVINLSLGTCESSGPDPIELAAVENAISKGVVVVAAAGNERAGGGTSPCTQGNAIDFPAAYPGVIAVGASALNDTNAPSNPQAATEYVASYSNSGPGLTIVAPGGDPPANDPGSDPLHWITNIYSTTGALVGGQNVCAGQTLCAILIAGTSQATPHAAGAAALMLAAKPGMSPAQVKKIMESTADNINDTNQGFGRLDVYRAVAAALGDPNPPAGLNPLNFVAFAYTTTANKPNILDITFPNGVPVGSNSTFRVPDVPAGSPSYKIGVWYDANGDGIVDAGDWFGSAGPCTASSPCGAASTITVTPFGGGPLP